MTSSVGRSMMRSPAETEEILPQFKGNYDEMCKFESKFSFSVKIRN